MLKLTPSAIALIVGNLVPIIGVLFFSWQLFPVVLLYWLENVVIGVINAIKMLSCSGSESLIKKVMTTLFFAVHYGMFCAVHGAVVLDLFGGDAATYESVTALVLQSGIKWALLALILSHLFSLISNYYMRGERQELSASKVMFLPYRRIIVLHVFIIFGAMALQTFGVTQWGLIALAVVKILADLLAHSMERKHSS